MYLCTIKVKGNFDGTNVSFKTLKKMVTLDKIRAFIADEVLLGNERCSVRPSSKLSDVVYLHVEDTSLSFLFLERLSQAVSPDFDVCSCLTANSTSFDIQFILDV